MTYEFLKTLYSDILQMIDRLVIKRMDLARAAETTESARAFELYYACLTGSRYFYNFYRFDADILEKYLPSGDVASCYYDPNKIPEQYRAQIVSDQAARVIDSYEELNEYYRMLAGLPRRDDHQWIYVTDYADVPHDVPVHQLTIEQISRLETRGKLDELKEQYPDRTYLDYLGSNAVDIIEARLAKPFEILRLGVPTNALTEKMFEEEYYMARRYVMATIYNRSLFTNRDLYDPIIGLMMIGLAVRNTLVPNEAEYLNFEEILDAILESYGFLGYFEDFPFTYKKRLVMALDKLLMVKGTDGVLVDICRIFSFDNFYAKRYYLMKTYIKDNDGNIIFTNNVDQQYDLNFVKSDIEDHEISYDEENRTDYEAVVNNDYLWQLTEEELHSLKSEDFNLMMTKYIGIEAAYDLSALTFEVCYFLNLILQSRDNVAKIKVPNKYATSGSSDLYTMIIFLLASLAKRSGFDGNIVYDPENIAEILRFNNADITEELQAIVDKYELQVDVTDNLIPGYDPVQLELLRGSVKQLNVINTYVYNREMYNAIINEMNTTNDIRKYIALSNAKQCMYISAMEEEDFKLADGSPASTYAEMLESLDPKLTAKLDSLDLTDNDDSADMNRLIIYILENLEELFNSNELYYLFLNTPNIYVSLLSRYLRIAINVFKASSVQLESINVFFNAGDNEPIRVIDHKITHESLNIDDTIHVIDEVALHKTIVIDEIIRVGDKAYTNDV